MTYTEFVKAVKQCKELYGYVNYSDNDGFYVKLVKADVLYHLSRMKESSLSLNVRFNAEFNNERDLYIN